MHIVLLSKSSFILFFGKTGQGALLMHAEVVELSN